MEDVDFANPIENIEYSLVVFFILTKAFDTAKQKILLKHSKIEY